MSFDVVMETVYDVGCDGRRDGHWCTESLRLRKPWDCRDSMDEVARKRGWFVDPEDRKHLCPWCRPAIHAAAEGTGLAVTIHPWAAGTPVVAVAEAGEAFEQSNDTDDPKQEGPTQP